MGRKAAGGEVAKGERICYNFVDFEKKYFFFKKIRGKA
jgi:hypothetical protein